MCADRAVPSCSSLGFGGVESVFEGKGTGELATPAGGLVRGTDTFCHQVFALRGSGRLGGGTRVSIWVICAAGPPPSGGWEQTWTQHAFPPQPAAVICSRSKPLPQGRQIAWPRKRQLQRYRLTGFDTLFPPTCSPYKTVPSRDLRYLQVLSVQSIGDERIEPERNG
ncbi:hypothetical protein SKAU_G00316960 [Synaphobranchus kaupii]|uniref:Uncharacterized protein n=1 Tax=Synaphobranchus kaupii TaxID=118154 RepID=A0A9Q1ILU1_SYNKA|nr:hypothetical protein SKAU_G00316960 [Synaphobranchus kaupii]